MELFAGLFFYRLGIGVQRSDALHIVLVFFLEAVDVALERLEFGVLLAVDDHAIGAEQRMQKQSKGKQGGGGGAEAAPLGGEP